MGSLSDLAPSFDDGFGVNLWSNNNALDANTASVK
jgi:hypothetical protein